MCPRQAQVIADAARIQGISAYQRPDKRPVAVRADQAGCVRPAVMKTEPFPKLFIRIKTQVQRIQKTAMNKPETVRGETFTLEEFATLSNLLKKTLAKPVTL